MLLQEPAPGLSWTYVWLAAGGLLLALAALAFAYLLVRSRWTWFGRLMRHPLLEAIDRRLNARVPRLRAFLQRRLTMRQWHGLALTVAVVVLFGCVYAFALITESWTDEAALYRLDQRVYLWLMDAVHPRQTALMRSVTFFGNARTITVLGLLTAAYLLYRRYWWRVIALVLAVGVGAAIMEGLKWLFARSRPDDPVYQATGHSFPSGHAFAAVTFYGFLIYLVWRMVRQDAVRLVATAGLVMLIVGVGVSRVLLRVHWASDVAGGLTVGLAWLVCSLVLTRALRASRSPAGPDAR